MLSTLLSAAIATAVASSSVRPERWPGGRATLESVAPSTATVVVGVAAAATITERHAAHLSTAMRTANGAVIRGGGMLYFASCKQNFRVAEVLRGDAKPGERAVEYSFVQRAQGFPLPSSESAIPKGAHVILLLNADGALLKSLPDTPDNRKAVRAAIPAKK